MLTASPRTGDAHCVSTHGSSTKGCSLLPHAQGMLNDTPRTAAAQRDAHCYFMHFLVARGRANVEALFLTAR
eukprot:698416-Pelagomonas_calceolata.AAC.1